MRHPGTRLCAFFVSAALVAPGGMAQTASSPKQDAPSIRATARLVQVSVIVRDRNGNPVTDLKQSDFTLLDDGQPQTLTSFSVQVSRAARTTSAARPPLPPNTFTNRPEEVVAAPASVTVILFDALNTQARDQTYGKNQVARFLDQLQPEDRVALYALANGGITILHDFTADPAPLMAALARYRGREQRQQTVSGPSSQESGMAIFDAPFEKVLKAQENFQVRDRVAQTVDAFVAIANHLSKIPGRKNLVWVSGSFPITFGFDQIVAGPAGENANPSIDESFAATSAIQSAGRGGAGRNTPPAPQTGGNAGSAPQPIGDPDLKKPPEQGVFIREMERAARALNQAGMAIYPVDARGLIATIPTHNTSPTVQSKWVGADRQTIDSMNLLAERTGGRAFYNTNDIQGSVRRAIDDSRATYELAYTPAHDEWNGKFREIYVRVNRPGLDVRHRRGYYAVADAPAEDAQAQLAVAADLPFESSVLTVTARMEPRSGAGLAAWNVRLTLDAREVQVQRKEDRWMGALTVLFVQKRGDGATLSSSQEVLDLKLAPATYERLVREGMRMTKSLTIDPEAYELRVIVRDTTSGATGSVHIPISRLTAASK